MNTNSSLTSKHWLEQAQNKLKQAGIDTARLDCLVLLEDATKKDKSYLLAHPELPLQGSALKRLDEQINRRCKHEPLAYIRGKSEFYGREFIVSPATLEPRPETETVIELLKQLVDSRQLTVDSQLAIADVGTGSGCLAITVKSEFPMIKVHATDISPECIKIAKQNAQKHGVDIGFYHGDLLRPLLSTVDCRLSAILANLPYVPNDHKINNAAMHEPAIAIFGGSDGLDLYRRLFEQISKLDKKPDTIITESLPFQHNALTAIANSYGYMQKTLKDLIQVFQTT